MQKRQPEAPAIWPETNCYKKETDSIDLWRITFQIIVEFQKWRCCDCVSFDLFPSFINSLLIVPCSCFSMPLGVKNKAEQPHLLTFSLHEMKANTATAMLPTDHVNEIRAFCFPFNLWLSEMAFLQTWITAHNKGLDMEGSFNTLLFQRQLSEWFSGDSLPIINSVELEEPANCDRSVEWYMDVLGSSEVS